MREIITLQFGENANYVGTHYWNMVQHQNSTETDGQTNTSVLFSEQSGDRSKQERRPRVLIFDKVDSFGSLGRDALQSAGEDTADQESALWGGQTEVYRQQLYAKPTLPQTQSPDDDSVAGGAGDSYERRIRYWSDFNELKYDSRSFNSVSGVEFGNSIGELNTFLEGMQVFAGEDGRDDVLEGNLRVFAEESDYLQGFQVFADAVGGFAGYGSAFMAKARDEFPKTPILLYNAGGQWPREKLGDVGLMDFAVATATNLESVSISVPLFAPSHISKLYPNVEIKNSIYQISGFAAMNATQWSHSLVAGSRVLDDIVTQATQQGYLKLAESLVSPGLSVELDKTKHAIIEQVGKLIKDEFVACSDVSVDSLRTLGGLFAVDRGTRISDLLSGWYMPAAYVHSSGGVTLPASFPRLFRDIDRNGYRRASANTASRANHGSAGFVDRVGDICVSGLLCTTAATADHLQQQQQAIRAERSRHLKDYEREDLRELKSVLDKELDKYASIS